MQLNESAEPGTPMSVRVLNPRVDERDHDERWQRLSQRKLTQHLHHSLLCEDISHLDALADGLASQLQGARRAEVTGPHSLLKQGLLCTTSVCAWGRAQQLQHALAQAAMRWCHGAPTSDIMYLY
jgi:hypothetical protein